MSWPLSGAAGVIELGMAEAGGAGTATTFSWGACLFGAQADAWSDASTTMVNLSALSDGQDFSSPTACGSAARRGWGWLQTDRQLS